MMLKKLSHSCRATFHRADYDDLWRFCGSGQVILKTQFSKFFKVKKSPQTQASLNVWMICLQAQNDDENVLHVESTLYEYLDANLDESLKLNFKSKRNFACLNPGQASIERKKNELYVEHLRAKNLL